MSTAGTAPKINAIIEVNPELMNIIKQEFLISGLKVYAYSHKSSLASDKPIQVHFMLHWRLANCAAVDSAARKAVLLAQAMKDREHDLVVIVFVRRFTGYCVGYVTYGEFLFRIIATTVCARLSLGLIKAGTRGTQRMREWTFTGLPVFMHVNQPSSLTPGLICTASSVSYSLCLLWFDMILMSSLQWALLMMFRCSSTSCPATSSRTPSIARSSTGASAVSASVVIPPGSSWLAVRSFIHSALASALILFP